VREREAAWGSWTWTKKVPWSSCGRKPCGVFEPMVKIAKARPAVIASEIT